jgi:N-acetylglucosaminyl-diphospho-decaprenol L-rhamnosyltransferase
VAAVDVVIVSYNSRAHLRRCAEGLASVSWTRVYVVDNASPDRSPEVVADLSVDVIESKENRGFASGCNLGIRAGHAPYVLLLNPDAQLDPKSLSTLVEVLEQDQEAGAIGPRIVHEDGGLDHSLRRFPRLRSTFARALFLHHAFPRSAWADEVIRDEAVYERGGTHDWISGACILVRRSLLERLGGLDDGFFMYCEDKDLCARIWESGFSVRFEPRACCIHDGGGSAPQAALLPVLAASRLRYAQKHTMPLVAACERVGLILNEAVRSLVTRAGPGARTGHARSLFKLIRPDST